MHHHKQDVIDEHILSVARGSISLKKLAIHVHGEQANML